MIANALGHELSLPALRRRFPPSGQGASLRELLGCLDRLDLQARALKVDTGYESQLSLPAILHWNQTHFVVLTKIDGKNASVNDPAQGEFKLSLDDFRKSFSGVAIEVSTKEKFEPIQDGGISYRHLWQGLRAVKSGVAALIFLSILVNLGVLFAPLFVQSIIDVAIPSESADTIVWISVSFFFVYFFVEFAGFARRIFVISFTNNTNLQVVGRIVSHVIGLSPDYFQRRSIADSLSRLSSIRPIQLLLSDSVVVSIVDGLLSVAIFLIVAAYSLQMALLLLLFSVVLSAFIYLTSKLRMQLERRSIIASVAEQNELVNGIRSFSTLKLLNKQGSVYRRWSILFRAYLSDFFKLSAFTAFVQLIEGGLYALVFVGCIGLLASMAVDGAVTIGQITALAAYLAAFSIRLRAFLNQLVQFRLARVHLQRVGDFIEADSEQYLHGETPLPSSHGKGVSVRLEQVSYKYGVDSNLVLNDCNLKVSPGETVVIVGENGAGKSTLLRLIVGLIDANEGEIFVEGIDLRKAGKHAVRERTATVFQDDQLLPGTIRDNINPKGTGNDATILEYIRAVGLTSRFSVLPMGLDTRLGESEGLFSAGEKQKLILLRAILRKPDLLLLDECTANLDAGSEELVANLVSNHVATKIIVSHRPRLLEIADRVLVLRDGRLHER